MNTKNFEINELFEVHTGDYHATKELDPGDVPLISCGDADNGLIGFYEIPEENQYSNTITVAYNGQPLTAKYHPYRFGAKDDVAVLVPKTTMSERTLIYVAAVFNQQKWRYSYGRKCFKTKFETLTLTLPATDDGELDTEYIEESFGSLEFDFPDRSDGEDVTSSPDHWEKTKLSTFFTSKTGDFNKLPEDPGEVPTVSRVIENNGIRGYHEPPEGAEIYTPPKITVSTGGANAAKAFVQFQPFIASDKVVILTPTEEMDIRVLYFIQMMIDRERWRYSYSRSYFADKVAESEILLPMTDTGELDTEFIFQTIESTAYWDHLESESVVDVSLATG